MSRTGWALLAIAAAAVALFTYSVAHGGHLLPQTRHSVTLKWNPSQGATSYNVYRSDGRGAGYTKIATTTEPTFVDRSAPSGTVLYAVTAIRDDQESPFSNETRVQVP